MMNNKKKLVFQFNNSENIILGMLLGIPLYHIIHEFGHTLFALMVSPYVKYEISFMRIGTVYWAPDDPLFDFVATFAGFGISILFTLFFIWKKCDEIHPLLKNILYWICGLNFNYFVFGILYNWSDTAMLSTHLRPINFFLFYIIVNLIFFMLLLEIYKLPVKNDNKQRKQMG